MEGSSGDDRCPAATARPAVPARPATPDASNEWRGRKAKVPRRRDDVPAFQVVEATIRAPGRATHALSRSPAAPGLVRGPPDEVSWFVVLRPAPRASGAGK